MPIRKNILIVLIFLMIGVFASFSFLIYQETQKKKNIPQELVKEKKYPNDLKGKVYLTLKEKETNRNKDTHGVFTFDFKENYFGEEYFSENQPIFGGGVDFQNERMLTVMSFPRQIYIANKNREIEQITRSADNFKKEAVWSNDGKKIVFMSTSAENSLLNTNSWNITISDLSGNEEKIAVGAHPFFSPDDKKILFLKENGVNLIDLETKKEKRVYDFNINVDNSFHLGLSLDGSKLVVSDPVNRNIKIFKINSWENFQLEEFHKIETPSSSISWPKFDPYGDKYLIYEELLNDGRIELVAYNLENSQRYSVLDLSFYEHNFMWINDWR